MLREIAVHCFAERLGREPLFAKNVPLHSCQGIRRRGQPCAVDAEIVVEGAAGNIAVRAVEKEREKRSRDEP